MEGKNGVKNVPLLGRSGGKHALLSFTDDWTGPLSEIRNNGVGTNPVWRRLNQVKVATTGC
jgi:hypothetical protein